MPLYEYECEACGHRFEKIQKFSDAPVDECPACGAKQVHKLVSSPAIQFKGSGWYITDYAKKGMTAADGSKVGEPKGEEKADKGEKGEKSAAPASKDDKPSSKDAKPATASPASKESSSSSASTSTPSSKS